MKYYNEIEHECIYENVISISEYIKKLQQLEKDGATHISYESHDEVWFKALKEEECSPFIGSNGIKRTVKITYEQRPIG